MRSVKVISLIAFVCAGILVSGTSFAGSSSGSQCGKALSKPAGKSSFQGAADHVSKWGASRQAAKESSLRGNKEALKKRRCGSVRKTL